MSYPKSSSGKDKSMEESRKGDIIEWEGSRGKEKAEMLERISVNMVEDIIDFPVKKLGNEKPKASSKYHGEVAW